MQSSGGLTSAHLFEGKDAILSGPAGGVVGAVETARLAGFTRVIGFDMGGTSTDVCHFDGVYERTFESVVAGVRVRAPMMLIHTVAAGGGSILFYDGARFRVGPDSAGANPGPACYRRGGPLTVTDANVMVGKLVPEFFPKIFGPAQDQPLDAEVVRERFAALAAEIGDGREAAQVADGFIRIAVENMANAILSISVQRGYDVTDYVMNSFGGAGGQHACLVADALGIGSVLLHPLSGVLSAYGMGLAELKATRSRAVLRLLDADGLAAAEALAAPLADDAKEELEGQGVARAGIRVSVLAHLRYLGTDSALPVADSAPLAELQRSPRSRRCTASASALRARISRSRSRRSRSRRLAAATIRMSRTCRFRSTSFRNRKPRRGSSPVAPGTTRQFSCAPVSSQAIASWALPSSSSRIRPSWSSRTGRQRSRRRTICCSPARRKRETRTALGTSVDPVLLEVFNKRFTAIAEQMGYALQNTARSVNIKERLDFSCAIFDGDGRLVANAPHIPVHLGSMDRSVETVRREVGSDLEPGDVWMLNAPYNGGTHLPDITVVTPVFAESGAEILFFVAARGHHADIGGIAPGSMSPKATRIEEEGVYIDPFKLVEGGRFREDAVLDASHARPLPCPRPGAEHRRPEGAGRGQRQGRGRARQDGGAIRARRGAGLYGPCAGQRRGKRGAGDRRAGARKLRGRDRHRRAHQSGDRHRPRARQGHRRFHRNERATAGYLQCARADHAGLRALCLPHAGR